MARDELDLLNDVVNRILEVDAVLDNHPRKVPKSRRLWAWPQPISSSISPALVDRFKRMGMRIINRSIDTYYLPKVMASQLAQSVDELNFVRFVHLRNYFLYLKLKRLDHQRPPDLQIELEYYGTDFEFGGKTTTSSEELHDYLLQFEGLNQVVWRISLGNDQWIIVPYYIANYIFVEKEILVDLPVHVKKSTSLTGPKEKLGQLYILRDALPIYKTVADQTYHNLLLYVHEIDVLSRIEEEYHKYRINPTQF